MAGFSLNLPERRRNYKFALTPLADAMFQLLIFFMLSAGLTPYSLLTLQTAPAQSTADARAGASENDAEAPPALRQDTGGAALWTVEADGVRVGGQRFGFDALDALAGALGTTGNPGEVILIVRASAQVQDISTVLASLNSANITSVRLSTGASF